jgi:hypothetical protein
MSGVVQVASPTISIERKKCSKCGEVKRLDEFGSQSDHTDGHASACKVCVKGKSAEYYLKHKEKILKHNKQWYKDHPEHVRLKSKKRRIKYPEKVKEYDRRKYIKKREEHIVYACRYAKLHPEQKRETRRRWAKNNPDKIRIKNMRINNTPKGKINGNISSRMRKSLHGLKSGQHWESLVGFTVDQLKTHLEKLFKKGMDWSNYGSCWHIDHKIPLSAFNFETPEDIDFKKAWALSNLQPLWANENTVKKDKLIHPFQPSLCINC